MENINIKPSSIFDFAIFFRSIYRLKKRMLLFLSITILIFLVLYIFLPREYQSLASLEPVKPLGFKQSEGLGGLTEALMLSGGNDNLEYQDLALAVVMSMDFFEDLTRQNNFLPDLWAFESDKEGVVNYDSNKYDQKNNKWITGVPLDAKTFEPSLEKSFNKFHKNHFKISVNKEKGGVFILSVTHPSKKISKDWLTLLIKMLNSQMQQRDIISAEKSISFLENLLKNTTIMELRLSISQLIEQQLNKLTIAKIESEYAFKVIDSPRARENHVSPSLVLFIALIALIGIFLPFAAVFLLQIFNFVIQPRNSFPFLALDKMHED